MINLLDWDFEEDELDITDVDASDILAVTNKNFVLNITIHDEFDKYNFSYDLDDERICDEAQKLFKEKYKEITDLTKELEVEGDEDCGRSLSWFCYCTTRPLTAQEVVKVKEYYDSLGESCTFNPIRQATIIKLV